MNFTENINLGWERNYFPCLVGCVSESGCYRENIICFVITWKSKVADTCDACKLVHFSLRISPAAISTSSFLGSRFTKWLVHFCCISKEQTAWEFFFNLDVWLTWPFPLSPSLFPSSVWGGGSVFRPFGHRLPGHRPLPAGHQRLRQRQLSQWAAVVQRSACGCVTSLHPL